MSLCTNSAGNEQTLDLVAFHETLATLIDGGYPKAWSGLLNSLLECTIRGYVEGWDKVVIPPADCIPSNGANWILEYVPDDQLPIGVLALKDAHPTLYGLTFRRRTPTLTLYLNSEGIALPDQHVLLEDYSKQFI